MSEPTILLGYTMTRGDAVHIPIRHMAVAGITQDSGKTTTLEALIGRGRDAGGRPLRAVCFLTKRGEGAFQSARRIPPMFATECNWQYVEALVAAYLDEDCAKLRLPIMQACEGAASLKDVQAAVAKLHADAAGAAAERFYILGRYLSGILQDLATITREAGQPGRDASAATGSPRVDVNKLDLAPGINCMDLAAAPPYLQGVAIASVLDYVGRSETGVVVLIPEAWEMIPLRHGSPCKLAAERIVRKGACNGNYLWLDSQDLAAVGIEVRKACTVYLLGVQREANEVDRHLKLLRAGGLRQPTAAEVMGLARGWFYCAFGREMHLVYVQPRWLDSDPERARRFAQDIHPPSYVAPPSAKAGRKRPTTKAGKDGAGNAKELGAGSAPEPLAKGSGMVQ